MKTYKNVNCLTKVVHEILGERQTASRATFIKFLPAGYRTQNGHQTTLERCVSNMQ